VIYIEAPNYVFPADKKNIFLAGTIQGTITDWQTEITKALSNLDIVVFNPRRKNFPIHDSSAAEKQITWEFRMLRQADIISFWFAKETLGPIVLFELGAHTRTDKLIVIGMDPEYQRRQDVEIQTKLVRPDIKIVYNLNDLAEEITCMFNMLT
jgi:hypothetical protein